MIVIIDYGLGNPASVKNIIKKVGGNCIISGDIEVINNATKLILPGVGHFAKGMENLKEKGLDFVIKERVKSTNVTLLGICLGMQLLTNKSEEGMVEGLGLIDAETLKFSFDNKKLTVPHMGWNNTKVMQSNTPLFQNIEDPRYYFVHSYYVKCKNQENVLTTTNYGHDFDSGIINKNVIGLQFHPEKSHKFGMQLFKNFIDLP